jgi:AraC-like DNA-binding protein
METIDSLFSRFVAEAMISAMRQGLAVDELLADTGVSLSQLHQPDFRLSLETGIYIIYRIYSASPINGVALRIGAQMRPSDFGHLGLAMISAPTIAAGLGKLHKLSSANALPWQFTLIEKDAQTSLILHTNDSLFKKVLLSYGVSCDGQEWHDLRRYFLEIGLMMARSSWLYAGQQVMPQPLMLHLDYPRPPYIELYQRYFDCPVYFEQASNAIVFRTPDLLVKPVGYNQDLLNYSEQQLNASSKQSKKTDSSWCNRTRVTLKHGGIPFLNAEAVAKQLNISGRVLRRHLAEEGSSFRQITQQVREELARQYLQREELSVQEVAGLLGYSETAAFSRSFKQWTGVSPVEFRISDQKQ